MAPLGRYMRYVAGILRVVATVAVLGVTYCIAAYLPNAWVTFGLAEPSGTGFESYATLIFGQYASPVLAVYSPLVGILVGYIAHMRLGGGALTGMAVGAIPTAVFLMMAIASPPFFSLAIVAYLCAKITLPCVIGGALAMWRQRRTRGPARHSQCERPHAG